jgi:hypothetical protein
VNFRKDPVLAIWQGRNLLAEVEISPETFELSKIVAETELVLLSLISMIVAKRKLRARPRLRLISTSDDIGL